VEHETFAVVTAAELAAIHAYCASGKHLRTFVAAYYADSETLELVKEESDSDKVVGTDLVELILEADA
jgi:hypothetical protein